MERPAQLLSSVLLVIVFVVSGCKNPDEYGAIDIPRLLINKSDTRILVNNGLVLFDSARFTGTLYELYPTQSDTLSLSSYLNGHEHGEWKQFYERNKLKEHRFFKNGKKEGDYLAWWPDGTPQLHYRFQDDEYSGECREWNQQGLLTQLMHYKEGHEAGSQQWWYDNGKIKANYVIKEGRRFGLLGTKNCINVSDSVFSK